MASIKKNFAWSSILTAAGYVFPLITFPYITRVLGVERIGATDFANNVISYFSVFAMLGMSYIGVREIAKVKDNREELSKVFSSLLVLNLITTVIAILSLLVLIQLIPSFSSHSRLLYIGIGQILCGSLLIEWLYKGLEEFRFVTIRSLVIRFLYVASVFIFVKDPNDYILYFTLTTLTTVINSIVNIVYARNFISIKCDWSYVRKFSKPFLIYGIYMVLTSMYGSFNVIFLGASCGDVEVGYYSIATKLYAIIMSVFTAFTTVMMPRMSFLIAKGDDLEFKRMSSKSIDFLLLFSIPLIVFFEVYAPTIIQIVAGSGYEGSILPMRILIPLVLIVGYEQIIIVQMLMPMGKDFPVLINSGLGAAVAIVLNLSLVHYLGSFGSSLVCFASELVVAFSAQHFVNKYAGYSFPFGKITKALLLYIPGFLACFCINHFILSTILSMIVSALFLGAYSIIIETLIIKNQLVIEGVNYAKNAICRYIN